MWKAGAVAVAAWADATAEHRRQAIAVFRRDLAHQVDRIAVDPVQLLGRIIQPVGPVLAGPPGRAFEDEARPGIAGDVGIAPVVALQMLAPGCAGQKLKSREVSQFQAFEKDQAGFDAAIGQEDPVRLMRQGVNMGGHDMVSLHPGPCFGPMPCNVWITVHLA
jgi:hypothetical protein